jgi:hypothetical protein
MHAHDEVGDTPLHYITSKGCDVILQWILQQNPDFTVRNLKQQTPLDVSLRTTSRDMIIDHLN